MLAPSLRSVLAIRQVSLEDEEIRIEAEGATPGAVCPDCGTLSLRVHGRYCRQPIDLPWRGRLVRFLLTVRSYCCDNSRCPRVTFGEDFGDALPRYARRTKEATERLVHLACAAGGEAGARLAAIEGLPTSPDTLLRLQQTGSEHLPVADHVAGPARANLGHARQRRPAALANGGPRRDGEPRSTRRPALAVTGSGGRAP